MAGGIRPWVLVNLRASLELAVLRSVLVRHWLANMARASIWSKG